MLHIGSTDVTVAVPDAKRFYVGSNFIGLAKPDKKEGPTLHLYDRVDNKATVAGFFTDGNGQKYAVCVVDAQYRYYGTGGFFTSRSVPQYDTEEDVTNATESATYLSSLMVQDGWSYGGSLEYEGVTYNYLRPNVPELKMILNDAENLDSYDPDSSRNSLTDLVSEGLVFTCSGSSKQMWYYYKQYEPWGWGSNEVWKNAAAGNTSYNTRVWIVEIPVSE